MANNSMVGALRIEATLESGKFVDGARKVRTETQKTEATVKKSFGGMSSSIGSSMGVLKASIGGLVAGLSVGLFTSAIKEGLKYAASLGEVSERLGVTTKDLQTFRYAAQQNGIAQEALDNGLEKLSVTLGKVAAGAAAPIKALAAIGVTVADLKNKDTGEAFRIIADGLQKVTDRSQRAAVEVALFGETGARLDALLSGGSSKVNELAAAAEQLGIVLSDEQIQNADKTADKLDALQTILKARIAGEVADNADAILQFADALFTLADRAMKARDALNEFTANYNLPNLIKGDAFGFNRAGRSVTVKLDPAKPAPKPASNSGNISQFLAPKGGGGRKRTPRAPKDTSLRDAFRFDEDLRRAQMDVLRATQDLTTDYVERGNIALQLLDLEKQDYERELNYQVASKEITQAQADQLKAQFDKRNALERQVILADRETQRAEDFAKLADLDFDLERDRLESQAQLARTAGEQREIQLRLLDIAYAQEKARLETLMADKSISDAAREEARRRLANLGSTYANDRQSVVNRTQGPLESFLGEIPKSAQEAAEWMEQLKVQGIEGAIDSIMALGDGFESFKDTAINAVKAVVAELIRMQLMKLAMNLIGNFSGFSGAGSTSATMPLSFLESGSQPLVPGFAKGGSMIIGGRGGTDKNLLSLNGLPIARVGRHERLDIVPPNQGGGGTLQIVPSPYFDVIVDGRAANVAAPMAGHAAVAGAAGGEARMNKRAGRRFP